MKPVPLQKKIDCELLKTGLAEYFRALAEQMARRDSLYQAHAFFNAPAYNPALERDPA